MQIAELKVELGGRYGVNVQWKAVRMVIKLNWRGIIMATIAVFTANLVSINALVDMEQTANVNAFLIRSLKWMQCIKTPGSTLDSCEYAAEKILPFWRAWSADLLISILGTEYFLLESSRRYTPPLPQLTSVNGGQDGTIYSCHCVNRSKNSWPVDDPDKTRQVASTAATRRP
jgi:hypothetical protein